MISNVILEFCDKLSIDHDHGLSGLDLIDKYHKLY